MSDLVVRTPVLYNSGSSYGKAPFGSALRRKLGQRRVSSETSLQIPKSHILQRRSEPRRMFSGLRLPWTIFSGLQECKKRRALDISVMIRARTFHVRGELLLFRKRRSWRLPLGKYSYTSDHASGLAPIRVTR